VIHLPEANLLKSANWRSLCVSCARCTLSAQIQATGYRPLTPLANPGAVPPTRASSLASLHLHGVFGLMAGLDRGLIGTACRTSMRCWDASVPVRDTRLLTHTGLPSLPADLPSLLHSGRTSSGRTSKLRVHPARDSANRTQPSHTQFQPGCRQRTYVEGRSGTGTRGSQDDADWEGGIADLSTRRRPLTALSQSGASSTSAKCDVRLSAVAMDLRLVRRAHAC
jgi:hypothetical protein